MITFFKSIYEEAIKVAWPSRQQVIQHSILVVATIVIATVIVAGVDIGFKNLLLLTLGSN